MTTTLSVTNPRWLDARCAQADPEAWHPELGGSADTTRYAKHICGQCPIQPECLTWALDTGQPHGIWGGTTPPDVEPSDAKGQPMRNHTLDQLQARGFYLEFYDPTGQRYGIPTFPWQAAPDGYATIRQLRAQGLRPGGQPVAAQIIWRHRKQHRVAYLYPVNTAKPKRIATPAQRAAIDKALEARRTCPTCRQLKPYYIPRRYGECLDCAPTTY